MFLYFFSRMDSSIYFQWSRMVNDNEVEIFLKSAKIMEPVLVITDLTWPTITDSTFRQILPYFEKENMFRGKVTKKIVKASKDMNIYAEVGKAVADGKRWDLVLEIASYFGEKVYAAR